MADREELKRRLRGIASGVNNMANNNKGLTSREQSIRDNAINASRTGKEERAEARAKLKDKTIRGAGSVTTTYKSLTKGGGKPRKKYNFGGAGYNPPSIFNKK